jgi:hypothetical protein
MIFRLVDDADSSFRQAGGYGGTLSDSTNVTAELFAQAFDQGVNLTGFAFGNQFHVAIVDVANGADKGEVGGQMDGGHAKTYALDVPGKENDASLGHGYQRETGSGLYAGVAQN